MIPITITNISMNPNNNGSSPANPPAEFPSNRGVIANNLKISFIALSLSSLSKNRLMML